MGGMKREKKSAPMLTCRKHCALPKSSPFAFVFADDDEDQYDYYMMTTEDDVPVDIDADKSLGTVGYM